MRSALARRGFIGRIAAIPLLGVAGLPFSVRRAEAASTRALLLQIDEAERRAVAASQAFEEALQAHEHELPQPHWSIDFTGHAGAGKRHPVERRIFDGEMVERHVNKHGLSDRRYIATVASLGTILRGVPYLKRWERKRLRRAMGQAASFHAAVAASEKRHALESLSREQEHSTRALAELVAAIFAEPATSSGAILVQARALCAYRGQLREQWATFQAGEFGLQLAQAIQAVGRAA